jgi:hypothetical protein
MKHDDILAETVARVTASFGERERQAAQNRLIAALRYFPPGQRAHAAEAAVNRLAKQEVLEAKIKALSDEDLDKVQIG